MMATSETGGEWYYWRRNMAVRGVNTFWAGFTWFSHYIIHLILCIFLSVISQFQKRS